MSDPGSKRYMVRVLRFTGTSHATHSLEASSLWEAVIIATKELEASSEIVGIYRVVTSLEELTPSERDTVELLTGGKISLAK
jgi:hypothetical protein